jgi:hypothetical protein
MATFRGGGGGGALPLYGGPRPAISSEDEDNDDMVHTKYEKMASGRSLLCGERSGPGRRRLLLLLVVATAVYMLGVATSHVWHDAHEAPARCAGLVLRRQYTAG